MRETLLLRWRAQTFSRDGRRYRILAVCVWLLCNDRRRWWRTIIGEMQYQEIVNEATCPTNMTNWFSFFFIASQKRYLYVCLSVFSFCIILDTSSIHMANFLFFVCVFFPLFLRIDSRGSGPHYRQFLRRPKRAWIEIAYEPKYFPSECQLPTGKLMMEDASNQLPLLFSFFYRHGPIAI